MKTVFNREYFYDLKVISLYDCASYFTVPINSTIVNVQINPSSLFFLRIKGKEDRI